MKQLLKSALSFNYFLPFKKNKHFIFVYHDVSSQNSSHHSPLYSTTPELFVQQIDLFASIFELTTLENLLKHRTQKSTKNLATIMFDDGFHSVISQALPILEKRKIPFSVFLNKTAIEKNQLWLSNMILQSNNSQYIHLIYEQYLKKHGVSIDVYLQNPINVLMKHLDFNDDFAHFHDPIPSQKMTKVYLDENDVKFLKSKKVLIGSHSDQHLVLSRCQSSVLQQEINTNKVFLEDLIDEPVQHFAIPFGKKEHYNDLMAQFCGEAGHHYLYTTNPVPVDKHCEKWIPRIGLTNQTPKEIMFLINRTFLKKYDL